MECSEARALIEPYLGGDLGIERSVQLERHLEGCATCPRALADARAFKAALRDKLFYHRAPFSLYRTVSKRLVSMDRPASGARPSLPSWLRVAASLMLVAGLSSGITYYAMPRAADAIPDAVFASHVRGVLSGQRLVDVHSSDEHTVRPWFGNKLDFSPPVTDLASEGFPLMGGRMDYVSGRTVAVLVYRRKNHVITLFIWPTSERPRAMTTSVRHGDTLVHWSDGAMAYWVVSDLDGRELVDFSGRFRAVTSSVARSP